MSAPGESRLPDNDLFISYSHLDNRPWGAGQRQWVTEFHRELQKRLEMLLGRDVSVWRDDKLAGNDVLDERIEGEVRRSRLFLCVMTPRYLKSEWCRREVDLFLAEAASTSAADPRRPFFKVIKTPIALEDQPTPSRSFRGYEFFRDVGAGKIHEFYPDRDENSIESREFWQKVDDLAQEMKAFLTAGSPPPSDSGRIVFLAETTADVRLARDAIRRELLQRGYRVVPDQPLPLSRDELFPLIEADLARASLTVHPVGTRYGIVPEGDRRSLVELQLDTALEKNGHADHLIWIAPDAVVDIDERQQQFLEKLRRVYTERSGTELLERKPLEELKTRLVEKLTKTRATAPVLKPRGAGLRVYLICNAEDLDAVKPIEAHLRAQGLRVHLPLMEGSEAELRQDHQETLVLCDAVIIYDGAGRPSWLRAKQRDLWKAPGWGRSRPLAAQAVFASRAGADDDQTASNDEFLLLRSGATFAPESMAPFMDALAAARDA